MTDLDALDPGHQPEPAPVDVPPPSFVPLEVPDETEQQQAVLAALAGLVPATAQQVATGLGVLGHRLQEITHMLAVADADSTRLAEEYQLAYARAFLEAGHTEDGGRVTEAVRRYTAEEATHQARLDMEVAKLAVRNLRQAHKTLDRRIDVGRTMAATVRSEHRAMPGQP